MPAYQPPVPQAIVSIFCNDLKQRGTLQCLSEEYSPKPGTVTINTGSEEMAYELILRDRLTHAHQQLMSATQQCTTLRRAITFLHILPLPFATEIYLDHTYENIMRDTF